MPTPAEIRARLEKFDEWAREFGPASPKDCECPRCVLRDAAPADLAFLLAENYRLSTELALMERVYGQASEVASIFQLGGALDGKLIVGDNCIVDGLKWLIAQHLQAEAIVSAARAWKDARTTFDASTRDGWATLVAAESALLASLETPGAGTGE